MCVCVYVVLSCAFFFFKQKTAYEMRIRDWSSDVCSSDLLLFPFARSVIAEATRNGGFPPLLVQPIDFADLFRRQLQTLRDRQQAGAIGRASCRESVCQYV